MNFSDSHSPELAAMLVELDCILDTRLGTIGKFGKEEYLGALTHGYFSRTSDHFFGIDPETYQRLYRERDAVTLSMSNITHIVSVVKDFVKRVNTISATAPVIRVPRIDVNLYPYNPPQRVKDMIEESLRVLLEERVDIGFVRYSPDDLHHDLVSLNYDHLIMYDVGAWVTAQAHNWKKIGKAHPNVTLFMPILCHAKNIADVPDDVPVMAEQVDRALTPLINIMQIPVVFFSSVVNPFEAKIPSPDPEGAEERDANYRASLAPSDMALATEAVDTGKQPTSS